MEQFFVLKIGASGIRKLNNFYYKVLHRQTLLQSGGNYYQVGQYMHRMLCEP